MTKTYSQKPIEVTRKWHLIDASDATLGRIATQAAKLLVGKHKPTFTPHTDGGDFVVVINSDKITVTGRKLDHKKYYRHSGYPGSTKEATLAEVLDKDSRQAMIMAVKGMLPRNKLTEQRLGRLKVFKDENHAHDGQKPKKFEMKAGK